MNKEKQIEEMAMTPLDILANDINQHCPDLAENYCGDMHCVACLANALYNAGYRKQSKNVIELSCKVGDKVYENYRNHIFEYVITSIEISSPYDILYKVQATEPWNRLVRFIGFDKYDIGETIFLTREEAEKGR